MGASIIAPANTLADSSKPVEGTDIYYTKEESGRWSGKVGTHLPNIEIEKAGGKVTVKIVTGHEMKAYEYYIVKHVLLDQNYKFLDEYMFDPTKDTTAISTFTLHDYRSDLCVEYVQQTGPVIECGRSLSFRLSEH